MRKLLIVVLVGMGLSKLFYGRVIPPEAKLTSSAGFNALADPKKAAAAQETRPKKLKGARRPQGEPRHYDPAWLPAHYEPGAWLKSPPHYEAEWVKQPQPTPRHSAGER